MEPSLKPFRSLGFYAVAWIENFLVHGPGDVQGQAIELDDEFAAFILKAYEVDESGARKVRRAFLSRSKGRSKSGLAAMIECFEALGECRFDHWAEPGEVSDWGYEFEPGEPVGRQLTYVECLNVATEESQAGNTYDAVYFMLNSATCSMELLERFGRLDVGLSRINLPDSRGFIEPVSAANESKDGGKSTFIVADETHLWMPPQAGVKRKQSSGWMLETSTMYAAGENSVAEGTHDHAKELESQGRRDGRLLFDHRQASDHWNLDKRPERIKALKEAYGPAAAWMDLEAIADYWDDPQASEAEFRRFWLNQPVPLTETPNVFDLDRWVQLANLNPDLLGSYVIGVDRSPDRQRWAIAASQRCRDGSVHVEIGFSGSASATEVVERILDVVTSWNPVAVVIDQKSPAAVLKPLLIEAGIEPVITNTTELNLACEGLAEAYATGQISHSDQIVLNSSAVAAVKREMTSGAFAWDRLPGGSIAPLMSATLAHWGLLTFAEPPKGPLVPPRSGAAREQSSDYDAMSAAF
jgi:hypothetical protein